MFRKMRFAYLGAGFLAGIVYLVACGGGSGVAQGIASSLGNAVDVVYSNVTSSLSASSVQAAVDEVVGRIKSLEEVTDSSSAIVGTWSLTSKDLQTASEGLTITFDAQGGFSTVVSGADIISCNAGTYSLAMGMLFLNCTGLAANDNNHFQSLNVALSDGTLYLLKDSNSAYSGTKQ